MKTKTVHWVRGAGAYELIFFIIMLGLAMFWIVQSLMPDAGENQPRMIKRLSLMKAAEDNASSMSKARRDEKEAMDRAAGKPEEGTDAN